MLIKVPRGWEIPEREATPESVYLRRREVLQGLGFTGLTGLLARKPLSANTELYPAKRNTKYILDRELTPEAAAIGINNFYEFTLDKQRVKDRVGGFRIDPWTVEVKGLVNNPKKYDFDDLIRRFPLEERLYRFRLRRGLGDGGAVDGFPDLGLDQRGRSQAEGQVHSNGDGLPASRDAGHPEPAALSLALLRGLAPG